jgi:hypothetical protein
VQKGGKSSYTLQYDDLYQLTAATGEWGKPRIADLPPLIRSI